MSRLNMAGVEGLEPPTPGFGDLCSSHLSYTPTNSVAIIRLNVIFANSLCFIITLKTGIN